MKYALFLLLIALAVFLWFPILHKGLYISHDGVNHVARFASYFQAFSQGQFPPRWAGETLNHGYGSPLFLFFYPLPGYLGSLLHLVGFSFTGSFIFLMGFSFIGMLISWYIWMSLLFKDKLLALLSSIMYVVIPYHLLDIYVRGDIGEVLSFVFLPLVFWALSKNSKKTLVIGALSYGLVLLSHNVMSLIFTPVLLFYGLMISSTKKQFLHIILVLGFGLSLAAFFWTPALLESKYLNTELYSGDIYREHFLPLKNVLYSSWGFGPNVNQPGGLSAQVGIVYGISFLGFWVFCWKKFNKNKQIIFWSLVVVLTVFLTTAASDIVWSHIALMRQFQFPWRFIALTSFALCVVITYGMSIVSRFWRYALVVAAVVSILSFVKVAGYVNHPDSYYLHFSGTTYFHNEATTRWVAGDPALFPQSSVAVISGNGKVQELQKTFQKQLLFVNAASRMRLVANTIYFPGWKVYIDATKTPIEFQDMNYRGLMTFFVPLGRHRITIIFTNTPIVLFSDIISFISIFLLAGIVLIYKNSKQ